MNLNIHTFNNNNDDDDNYDDYDDDYLLNAALIKKNVLPFVLLDPSLSVSHRKLKSDIMDLLRCVYHCQPASWTRCLGLQQTLMFFGVTHCKVDGQVAFPSLPVAGPQPWLWEVSQQEQRWRLICCIVNPRSGQSGTELSLCHRELSLPFAVLPNFAALSLHYASVQRLLVTNPAAALGDLWQIRMWNRVSFFWPA